MKAVTVIIILVIIVILAVAIGPFLISSSPTSRSSGSGTGVFKSADGGATWQLSTRSSEVGILLPASILSFVFDPGNPKVIYLGTKGGGLWVSKNGGDSWARLIDAKGVLQAFAEIYDISISAKNPKVMYLAIYQDNRGRVVKSTDGGITFEEIYFVPIERFGVFGAAVSSKDPNRVSIATGQGGFLESLNGGKSWRVKKWFPDGLMRLISNPANSSEFYVVTRGGEMYRTNNSGESWTRLTEGYREFRGSTNILDVALDTLNPSIIYAASKFGLLGSRNSGNIWRAVPIIIPPEALPVRAVAVDPKNSNRIYISAASQVYASEDFGEHWQILHSPASSQVNMLRVSPKDAKTLYAVVGK
ncbi:MAG: hypothetical protein HYT39_02340 [Candidatus Sungbacteria bacterium]|nr:hypothetical protein [Candidatus Sungbacteria bacterium]